MWETHYLLALYPHEHARLAYQRLRSALFKEFGMASCYALEPLIPLLLSPHPPAKEPLLPLAYRHLGSPAPQFTLTGAELSDAGTYLALEDADGWQALVQHCRRVSRKEHQSISDLLQPRPGLFLAAPPPEEQRQPIRRWLAAHPPEISSWKSSRLVLLEIEREGMTIRWELLWRFALRSGAVPADHPGPA